MPVSRFRLSAIRLLASIQLLALLNACDDPTAPVAKPAQTKPHPGSVRSSVASTVVGNAVDIGNLGYGVQFFPFIAGNGDVMGNIYFDGSENFHPARWTEASGLLTDIGVPNECVGAYMMGTNASGQIVGHGNTCGLYQQAWAFKWDKTSGFQLLQQASVPYSGPSSTADAINDAGIVAGWVRGYYTNFLPARWDVSGNLTIGAFNDAPDALSYNGSFLAINDAGQIAGNVARPAAGGGTLNYGFSWTPGNIIREIGSLDGFGSLVSGLSKNGTVVGTSGRKGFKWTETGGLVQLNTSEECCTSVVGVSDEEMIVGSVNNRGVRWTPDGVVHDLGDMPGGPPGGETMPSAVSRTGIITGQAAVTVDGNQVLHAFRWTASGGMEDLGDLTGHGSGGSGVNDLGQVSGFWSGAETRWARWNVGSPPVIAPPLSTPGPTAQISAGGYHTCASSVSGQMTCWGNNGYGQANVPSGAAPVSQPAAGYFHTCSLTTDGVVHCGIGDGTLGPVPSTLSQVAQIDAGEQYVMCALQTDRTVVCWGNNGGGNATVPAGLVNVAEVAVGHNHACAQKADGTVVCWGLNNEEETNVPSGLANVTQLTAGGFHSCALKADGTVACWGNNYFGESTVPSGLGNIVQVSAGYQHTCAVKSDATVVCWGNSDNGRTAVPVNLPPVLKVSAGRYHTCVITTAGNVICWGYNGFGQTTVPAGLNLLGMQSITFTSTPPSPALTGGTYAVAATGGSSGNAVTFSSLTVSICTVSGSSVSLVAVGSCTVAADQAAGSGYDAADQVVQTFVVNSPDQVIAFTSTPPSPGLVGTAYTISATGGTSGNPITFSSLTSATCSVSGSVVSFLQIGTCTIAVDQAGGGGYNPAPQISQSITVMATQTIVITSTPPNPGLVGSSYTVAGTGGGSGNPIKVSSKSTAVCSVSGRSIKLLAAGSCVVAANQAAGNGYLAASEVTQTFNVFIVQAINFTSSPPAKAMVGGTYVVTATGGASGNPVAFSSLTAGVCSVTGSTIQFLIVGTCTVAANQSGTATYAPAAQSTQSVKIK